MFIPINGENGEILSEVAINDLTALVFEEMLDLLELRDYQPILHKSQH